MNCTNSNLPETLSNSVRYHSYGHAKPRLDRWDQRSVIGREGAWKSNCLCAMGGFAPTWKLFFSQTHIIYVLRFSVSRRNRNWILMIEFVSSHGEGMLRMRVGYTCLMMWLIVLMMGIWLSLWTLILSAKNIVACGGLICGFDFYYR